MSIDVLETIPTVIRGVTFACCIVWLIRSWKTMNRRCEVNLFRKFIGHIHKYHQDLTIVFATLFFGILLLNINSRVTDTLEELIGLPILLFMLTSLSSGLKNLHNRGRC